MRKILNILIVLSLLLSVNTSVTYAAQPTKAQIEKQKAAEKKKKEQAKAKAKAAKEKEKAAAARAKEAEKKKAQAAKVVAAKEQQEEAQKQAWLKQQEELANPKPDIISYFNISPRVGYSAMMDKNQDQFNFTTFQQGNQLEKNHSLVGGGGAGLGLTYNLEYNHFLFETGLDVEFLNSTSRYAFDLTRTDTKYGATYHYLFDDLHEARNLMNVGIPVMFGATFDKVYFLVGARVGYDFWGTYKQEGKYDVVVYDPAYLEPYGLGIYDVPAPESNKLSFAIPDVKVCAEVGLDLDQWLQKQPTKEYTKIKVKPGERMPFGQHHIHYRVGAFAEYGVLNTNKMAEAAPLNFLPNSYNPQSANSLLAMAGTKLNNLFVGVKFTVQFEVPGKKMRPLPPPASFGDIRIVDNASGELLTTATVAVENTRGHKMTVKPKVLNKGTLKQRLALGDYRAIAEEPNYYKHEMAFSVDSPGIVVPVEIRMVHRPVFRVRVSNKENGEVLRANVQVRKRGSEFTPYVLATDSAEGAASVQLSDSLQYAVHVDLVGFEPFDALVSDLGENLHIQMTPIKKGEVFIMKNMFFATNKTRILPTSEQSLQELADYLTRNADIRIRIVGHTDNVGKDAANQKLSEGRAEAVREDLIKRGIAAERLEAEGRGESQPIDTNDTEEGRQNNRRVEIEVL